MLLTATRYFLLAERRNPSTVAVEYRATTERPSHHTVKRHCLVIIPPSVLRRVGLCSLFATSVSEVMTLVISVRTRVGSWL